MMKRIEVVAAIIRDDSGRIFATQRGYGEMKDGWEFPGGKMEAGETPEEALKREIWEELKTRIGVDDHIEDGHPVLLEHEAAKWLSKDELDSVDWLPADQIVVEKMGGL